MILALTPFEALCGFRPAATREVLQHVATRPVAGSSIPGVGALPRVAGPASGLDADLAVP